MSVHIGLMIWKEMKQKGMTIVTLSEQLAISKSKIQDIINSKSLDIELLVNISEALKHNFLAYYQTGAVFRDLSHEEKRKSSEEIRRLKVLLTEKNKALDLKDKTIQNLSNTISILEKGQLY